MLPYGNILPDSYVMMIQPYLVNTITFHVCANYCVIFKSEYSECDACPNCECSQYKPNSKIPVRRFIYMPLGQRLQRLYGTSNIFQLLQSHMSDESNEMFDILDSPYWKEEYSTEGTFRGDFRGVAVSLSVGGVNPFSVQRVSYSMWPIMLTISNLPRQVRNTFSNFALAGIILSNGPKQIAPFLDIVVDELLLLLSSSMYDAYRDAPFSFNIKGVTSVMYGTVAATSADNLGNCLRRI